MKSTIERKRRVEDFVVKNKEELEELISTINIKSERWKEKVKYFCWTKARIDIEYSNNTFYLDIFFALKKSYLRVKKEEKIASVAEVVCKYFDVDVNEVRYSGRAREHFIPRIFSMYFIKNLFEEISVTNIGEYFNRYHSQVSRALTTVNNALEFSDEWNEYFFDLHQLLYEKLNNKYMPKIFREDDMKVVYSSINEGIKIKDVANIIGKTPYEVNQLYNAAHRRTWEHYQRRMHMNSRAENKKRAEVIKSTSFERPKAEYSNSTPYGIANNF